MVGDEFNKFNPWSRRRSWLLFCFTLLVTVAILRLRWDTNNLTREVIIRNSNKNHFTNRRREDRAEPKRRHHPNRHRVVQNNWKNENVIEKKVKKNVLGKIRNSNKCRFRRSLKKILLAINFNFPYYDNIPMLMSFYQPHFGKVVFCGPEEDVRFGVIKMNGVYGWEGYHCLAKAIDRYSLDGYDGYFYSNDDVQLNFWNLNGDPDKVWIGTPISWELSQEIGQPIRKKWTWWANNTVRCKQTLHRLEELSTTGSYPIVDRFLNNYYTNTQKKLSGGDRRFCIKGLSDAFYIPSRHAKSYANLANLCESNKLFLEIASPMILHMLEKSGELWNLDGMYHLNYSSSHNPIMGFYETYTFNTTFSHPFKLSVGVNEKFFRNMIIPYARDMVKACTDDEILE